MAFKRGSGFKNKNNPIISELNAIGYTANNVHYLLECSKGMGYVLLKQPDNLKMRQIRLIQMALCKPLNYVLNKLYFTPDNSPNWLDESYNPAAHIDNLKRKK